MEKKYQIGKHEITVIDNEKDWIKLTGNKPARLSFDKDGFSIDWT